METSIFVKTLGNSSKSRIIEYLITSRGLPVHQADVIRNSKVSKVTVIKIWKDMIKSRLLVFDRIIGKAKLYKLNLKSPTIKKLIEIYDICLEQEANLGLKESVKISA